MVALARLWLPTCPRLPHAPLPPAHPPPACLPPIDSIRDITGSEKIIQKTSSIQIADRNSYKKVAMYNYTIFIYISDMTVLYHKRRTGHSIFQICIS